jgi:hypothetical protein
MSAEAIRCIDAFLGSTRRVQHQASRFEAALSRHLLTKGSRPHSTRRTPLGDLPESWEILSLGEVAQLASGRTKPSGASRVPSPSCSVPIYGPRGRIGFSEKSLRSGPTVVVGRVGRYCGSVHYVAEASCWVTDAAGGRPALSLPRAAAARPSVPAAPGPPAADFPLDDLPPARRAASPGRAAGDLPAARVRAAGPGSAGPGARAGRSPAVRPAGRASGPQ